MNTATFIHIGLPKCGSTHIKRAVFSRVSTNIVVPRGKLFKAITSADASPEFIRREILATHASPDGPLIVANEGLSGDMWTSAYSRSAAQNLAASFPNAKIILFLREQYSYLLSVYLFKVLTGTLSARLDSVLEKYHDEIVAKLQFDTLIQTYQELFSPDHVHVYPFERIRTDEESLYDELRSLMGVPIKYPAIEQRQNASINDIRTVSALRQTNLGMRWVVEAERRVKSLLGGEHNRLLKNSEHFSLQQPLSWIVSRLFHSKNRLSIPESFRSSTEAIFAASNTRTSDLLGISLADYGYKTDDVTRPAEQVSHE